jgi:hypothetical protein
MLIAQSLLICPQLLAQRKTLKNSNDFIPKPQTTPKKKEISKIGKIESLADAQKNEFQQYSKDKPPGALSHTLMAFGPGFLLHGAGHWAQGDLYSASRLLIVQGFSILALTGSYLLSPYQNQNNSLHFTHRLLEHSGWVLFLGSWLADMMGTFRGSGSFHEDSSRQFSSRFSLGYRYTMDPLFNLRHHIHTGLKLHFKYFYVSPALNWESKGNLKGIEVDIGTRLLQWGAGQIDFIGLGVQMRRWEWSELGFAQVNGLVYLHWRWHLKNFLHGLGGTSFFQKVGLGVDSYQFAENRTPDFLATLNQNILYLSIQSGMSINFSENMHLQISYIQDPTRDVRPIKNGDRLWGIQLISRQGPTIDIQAQVLIGEAWSAWLILNYHFAEIQRSAKKAFKAFQDTPLEKSEKSDKSDKSDKSENDQQKKQDLQTQGIELK